MGAIQGSSNRVTSMKKKIDNLTEEYLRFN